MRFVSGHRFSDAEQGISYRPGFSRCAPILAPPPASVLSLPHLGFSSPENMQRLTARLLLLFALAGNFIPLALAATSAPPHACCVRKAHHCHDSALAESNQIAVRAIGCCSHDCCRAVTTSQWANPQPSATPVFALNAEARPAESQPDAPAAQLSASQSTRAPPAVPRAS